MIFFGKGLFIIYLISQNDNNKHEYDEQQKTTQQKQKYLDWERRRTQFKFAMTFYYTSKRKKEKKVMKKLLIRQWLLCEWKEKNRISISFTIPMWRVVRCGGDIACIGQRQICCCFRFNGKGVEESETEWVEWFASFFLCQYHDYHYCYSKYNDWMRWMRYFVVRFHSSVWVREFNFYFRKIATLVRSRYGCRLNTNRKERIFRCHLRKEAEKRINFSVTSLIQCHIRFSQHRLLFLQNK